VVDQSEGEDVAHLLEPLEALGFRRLRSAGRGIALAVNEGMRAARNDFVLITHDDCTVAPDWVAAAHRLLLAHPDQIITGRVSPAGKAEHVPTIKDDPEPRDFTGQIKPAELLPNNMGVNRRRLLEFGGFDERFVLAGEDGDLAYRWMRAGRSLQYRPELVVVHHDWRDAERLRSTFRLYSRAQGMFYAKHLRRGDLRMLRYLVLEAVGGLPALPARVRRRVAGKPDPRRGAWASVISGFVAGWRMFRDPPRSA
jgi:GT2 family glycosyltransferase